MGLIEGGVAWVGGQAGAALVNHPLTASLVTDGVIAGVGAVVVFLPQILILFLFLGLLEDTGYMARAAFLVDRPLKALGLSGRSFIPAGRSSRCSRPSPARSPASSRRARSPRARSASCRSSSRRS
jgi:ferrous iron transport protein B